MNDSERAAHSIAEQIKSGVSYNSKAAIQAKMLADGFWPANVRELYDGDTAYMGAEHPRTGESVLYLWSPQKGVWRVPRPRSSEPPKDVSKALLGLHASANGGAYDEGDYGEFERLKPGLIKVMSNHDFDSVRKLASQNPNAAWIVRAYLNSGERLVTPLMAYNETINDVKRTLSALPSDATKMVELHNEPNLVSEGMFLTPVTVPKGSYATDNYGWCGGNQFNEWYMHFLRLYRATLPNTKFLFPGLSPGGDITHVRRDSKTFAKQCAQAIRLSDGIGIHTYWQGEAQDCLVEPLSIVDWYRKEFPTMNLWITEASNNKPLSWSTKAKQYASFWQSMSGRPTVKGITYFVVSGSYPDETWVTRDVARQIRSIIGWQA